MVLAFFMAVVGGLMILVTAVGAGFIISQISLNFGLVFFVEYAAGFGFHLPIDASSFDELMKISIISIIVAFIISFLSSLIRSALYGYIGSVLAFFADCLLYPLLQNYLSETFTNIITITVFCIIVLGMSIWGLFPGRKANPFIMMDNPRAMFLVGLIPSYIITFFMLLGSFVLLFANRGMEAQFVHGNIALLITTVYYLLQGIFFLWIYPEKIA